MKSNPFPLREDGELPSGVSNGKTSASSRLIYLPGNFLISGNIGMGDSETLGDCFIMDTIDVGY